jgi:TRAP-type C4-dicarboxylate transport system substrate-binding protein
VLAAGCALAVGVAGCGSDDDGADSGTGASAGDAAVSFNLPYATTQQHPYGQVVDDFVANVTAASGGEIAISGQPSYPGSELQLLEDVRNGTVDMATISTAVWDSAGINTFQALQAPFLVDNYALEGQVIEGEIGKSMAQKAGEAAGDLVVLAIHEGGLRKPVGAKKQLNTPAAFKGAKIRTAQSKVQAEGLQSLGAEADPLPLPEVFQALQNGTVDGMEGNLGLVASQKYYEVAKYITGNLNLWPFPTALVINKAKWDSLSDEQRTALQESADKAPAKSLEIVGATSTLPQDLVNCGMTFVYASKADKANLVKEAQAAVTSLSKDATTGDYIKQIQTLKEAQPAADPPPPFPDSKTGECSLG